MYPVKELSNLFSTAVRLAESTTRIRRKLLHNTLNNRKSLFYYNEACCNNCISYMPLPNLKPAHTMAQDVESTTNYQADSRHQRQTVLARIIAPHHAEVSTNSSRVRQPSHQDCWEAIKYSSICEPRCTHGANDPDGVKRPDLVVSQGDKALNWINGMVGQAECQEAWNMCELQARKKTSWRQHSSQQHPQVSVNAPWIMHKHSSGNHRTIYLKCGFAELTLSLHLDEVLIFGWSERVQIVIIYKQS